LVGERDHHRERFAELFEMTAHGDHVLLARQSSKVSVQHQQQRSAPMVAEPPGGSLVIDERHIGNQIPLPDHVRLTIRPSDDPVVVSSLPARER
jgi:hypothetical protein